MKDAKGHGSEKRGGNSVDTVFSSKAGVGGLGKGMYARLASGEQYKLNPAATEGSIPRVGQTLDPSQHTLVSDYGKPGGATTRLPVTYGGSGQAHVAQIAQQHGIQGGPFKVQSLALNRVGTPWATQRSYKNNTVAEHVARGMRIDGGYTRVKVR